MKNAIQRTYAKYEVETKAKAQFAALVEARMQAMAVEKATAKATASTPRKSIHYRVR
jgi:glutamate racemase